MTAYCTKDDLLLGNLPLGSTVVPEKYVQDAADEIDSKIGFRYKTPIDMTTLANTSRPAFLMLKRINVILATGRILLTLNLSDEEDRIHAVARSYIAEATAALNSIAAGDLDLVGIDLVNADLDKQAGPLILNEDTTSSVSDFYNYFRPSLVPYGDFGYGRRI